MIRQSYSPFFVSHDNTAQIFQNDTFKNTSDIHRYFVSRKNEDEYVGKYEALNAIIDCYADLRAEAEKREKASGYCHVRNPKKAIPISFEDIHMYFQSKKDEIEPPLRLITKVAVEHFPIINLLIHNLHKVLRYDRDFLPVDRAQQIDVQCIRWLSRQPGRTTYERAGNRQKILAVVRYESVDTLENRVFKQFLEYCRANCNSYIHEYHPRFPKSDRVLAVIRLRNLINYALLLPEFSMISNLNAVPRPNYVLQNNMLYRIIWDLYLQLLNRTKLVENLWKNRQHVIKEFSKMVFLVTCHKKADIGLSPIEHKFWLLQFADDSGSFFEKSDWIYMDYNQTSGTSYAFYERRIFFRYCMETVYNNEIVFGVAYVPENKTIDDMNAPADRFSIVFVEGRQEKIHTNKMSTVIRMDGQIVDNIFHCVQRICDVGEKRR